MIGISTLLVPYKRQSIKLINAMISNFQSLTLTTFIMPNYGKATVELKPCHTIALWWASYNQSSCAGINFFTLLSFHDDLSLIWNHSNKTIWDMSIMFFISYSFPSVIRMVHIRPSHIQCKHKLDLECPKCRYFIVWNLIRCIHTRLLT